MTTRPASKAFYKTTHWRDPQDAGFTYCGRKSNHVRLGLRDVHAYACSTPSSTLDNAVFWIADLM